MCKLQAARVRALGAADSKSAGSAAARRFARAAGRERLRSGELGNRSRLGGAGLWGARAACSRRAVGSRQSCVVLVTGSRGRAILGRPQRAWWLALRLPRREHAGRMRTTKRPSARPFASSASAGRPASPARAARARSRHRHTTGLAGMCRPPPTVAGALKKRAHTPHPTVPPFLK